MCTTLNSITKTCDNNQGGIFNILIQESSNITGLSASNITWSVDDITRAGSTASSFDFLRNVGSSIAEPKINLLNGSTYFEVKTTLVFTRREASKSRALTILGEGQRFLDLIYKDANGIYWYVENAQLDGGTEDSGTVRGDGSKYTVTFMSEMDHRPYTVALSAVAKF